MGFFTTGKMSDAQEETSPRGGFFTTGVLGGKENAKKEQVKKQEMSAIEEVLPITTTGMFRGERPIEQNKTEIPSADLLMMRDRAAEARKPQRVIDSSDIPDGEMSKQGAEIYAGTPTFTQKFLDLLPNALREGLFGQGEFTGDKGLVGFLEPGLTDTKSEKVMKRYDALKEAGLDDKQALNFAIKDTSNRFGTGGVDGLTDEQKKALNDIRSEEELNTVFMIGDLASFGTASKAKKAAEAGIDLAKGASEAERLKKIADIAENSHLKDPSSMREGTIEFLRNNPEEIKNRTVKLREVEGGRVVIEDGRHTLQVGMEKGVMPKIIDDTPNWHGAQPSKKIEELITGAKKEVTPQNVYDTMDNKSIHKAITEIDPHNPSLEASHERVSTFKNFKEAVNNSWVNLRERVEDDWIRVKKLQERPDAVVTDKSDMYMREKLYHGRVGSRYEEGVDFTRNTIQDTKLAAREFGISEDELQKDIDEYLIARHAPERNASIGERAAGMSDEEASEIMKRIESSPHASAVKDIANTIQDFHNKTLDILKESGVISDKLYENLTTKYKNHIPLQRVMDGGEDFAGALSSVGTDVRTSGIRSAKGSEREVRDVLGNVVYNYEQAILRSEKNRVFNSALNFARENKEIGLMKELKAQRGAEYKLASDPTVFQGFENGKKVFLKIEDRGLAGALKQINRERLPEMFKYVRSLTNFLSATATRYAPDFAFSNKVRDLQEAAMYMASKGSAKDSAKLVARDAKSVKTIIDSIRGVDSEDVRLYEQMVRDGGTTGGMGLSSREATEINIAKLRKINRSNPRQAAEKVLEYIDNWNKVFEDSTRFSAYKTALENGMSRDRAAVIAKEVSINFNKSGTWGPILNTLYMFSNVSIQGSAKMLRAMKNPKVLSATVLAVGSAVWASGEWNDKVDPEWREKVPKWDRMNSLPLVLPQGKDGQFNYIVIPISWGLKPIKVASDYAYDLTAGKAESASDAFGGMLASAIEGYNPVGGTDFTSAITPTVLDIPFDLSRNLGWYGSKIRPDWDKYAPASIQYFPSLRDTPEGKTFIGVSKGLSGLGIEVSPANLKYVFDQYSGGTGRFTARVADLIANTADGEKTQLKDAPFTSKFFRSRDVEQQGEGVKDSYQNILQSMHENESRERFTLKQNAEDSYQQMKNIPKEEANKQFTELTKHDPELAQAVYKIAEQEKMGLTYDDRMVADLGVTDGKRAMFITYKLNKLETKEEKAKLWQEYVDKKIITSNVAEQIAYLLKNPDKLNGME